MRLIDNKKRKRLFTILGGYLARYRIAMVIFHAAMIVLDVVFIIGWYNDSEVVPQSIEIAFYICQGALLLVSLLSLLLLVFSKIGKISDQTLGLLHHLFAAFLIAWGTVSFCFDLSLGFSPLLYLLVSTFVAGILVIDPIYFGSMELLSLIPVCITIANKPDLFFGKEDYLTENIIIFVAFLAVIIIIAFKNHHIFQEEYKIEKKLHELSYNDQLTGLLNERSYINAVEDLDRRIDNGENVKFAVILMDVNNLKVTNDTYGHRYGCSLIVRCGHMLPELFNSSLLFHIGGDEFIVIVMDEDLEHFDETMERFDEAMLFSYVEYEGKELIFSVARGYHIRQEGEHYKDVLQIADKAMYENKKDLKERYNMKGR